MRGAYQGGGLLGLSGSSIGDPLRQPSIKRGEKLEFIRFERAPGELAWFVRVRRPTQEVPYEALIPSGTAVKLGLVDQGTVDSLALQTTKAKLEEEAKRMARQADLDSVRHREEVVDQIGRWVKAYWFVPHLALLQGIMEEVWPGAAGQIAEDILRNLCLNQVTGLPATVIGACDLPGIKRDQGFPWLWAIVIGGVFLFLGGKALSGYARIREAGVKTQELRARESNERRSQGGNVAQGARAPGPGASGRLRAHDIARRAPWARVLARA